MQRVHARCGVGPLGHLVERVLQPQQRLPGRGPGVLRGGGVHQVGVLPHAVQVGPVRRRQLQLVQPGRLPLQLVGQAQHPPQLVQLRAVPLQPCRQGVVAGHVDALGPLAVQRGQGLARLGDVQHAVQPLDRGGRQAVDPHGVEQRLRALEHLGGEQPELRTAVRVGLQFPAVGEVAAHALRQRREARGVVLRQLHLGEHAQGLDGCGGAVDQLGHRVAPGLPRTRAAGEHVGERVADPGLPARGEHVSLVGELAQPLLECVALVGVQPGHRFEHRVRGQFLVRPAFGGGAVLGGDRVQERGRLGQAVGGDQSPRRLRLVGGQGVVAQMSVPPPDLVVGQRRRVVGTDRHVFRQPSVPVGVGPVVAGDPGERAGVAAVFVLGDLPLAPAHQLAVQRRSFAAQPVDLVQTLLDGAGVVRVVVVGPGHGQLFDGDLEVGHVLP